MEAIISAGILSAIKFNANVLAVVLFDKNIVLCEYHEARILFVMNEISLVIGLNELIKLNRKCCIDLVVS